MSKSILGKLAKFFLKDTVAEREALYGEKATFIAKLMELMEVNKFREAQKVLDKAVEISGFDTYSDPFIGTLRGRIALAISAKMDMGDPGVGILEDDAFKSFSLVASSLHETQINMLKAFPETPSPEQRAAYLQFAVVHQYNLFHTLKLISDRPGFNVPFLVADWSKLGFSEFNNYTGVDPFILLVCPPHHIWKKYIVDYHVYVTQDDGSIKMIPCGEYDFSKEPLGTAPSPHKEPKKGKAPAV